MKYDISLEQKHAVLGALLEIWRCIYIISLSMPVLHGNDLEPLCKVDNPSKEALVPKQVRMQKAKSEIKTAALDFTRQLQ